MAGRLQATYKNCCQIQEVTILTALNLKRLPTLLNTHIYYGRRK